MEGKDRIRFECRRLDLAVPVLELDVHGWDFDTFAAVVAPLLERWELKVLEQEANADLHVWLVDFEGCKMLLKAEHYSGQIWLEGLDAESTPVMAFLAQQLPIIV
ncbi:hypothetical protein ABT56_04270 [Photobacterium aquae]|uniref:Aminopeptidase n=2 Tax=Photobacterium aquae TaxID=1195763 RepID=A0A0J1H846_9GAMM|nr:hypothetical protein ABT56_04270 [Photobacterium aquae]